MNSEQLVIPLMEYNINTHRILKNYFEVEKLPIAEKWIDYIGDDK
jgi:hypothetical protein